MFKNIAQSTFIISTNGFADGPAQALRDYLLKNKAKRLTIINHPLVKESRGVHMVTVYEAGKMKRQKKYYLPNRPPFTFLFDLIIPISLPKCTAWFGFNNLAAWRGLQRKKRGRAERVYYWAVDFVPNRFGAGGLTRVYDMLDKRAVLECDGRIELSSAALQGRLDYLKLDKSKAALSLVVPMGAWLESTPKATEKNWAESEVVYLGHLVERQGVATLLEALALLNSTKPGVKAEIIGSGPLEQALKDRAKKLGLKDVTFHGFVKDHHDVEKIIASGTVAAAPYVKDESSFTQYADPGKLKAYLGAGLPIVLTEVPPNARELEKAGAAVVVEDTPQALADGISDLLEKDRWVKAHRSALKYAKQFDWQIILRDCLASLGFK